MKTHVLLTALISTAALVGCLQSKNQSNTASAVVSADCNDYVLPAGVKASDHFGWLSKDKNGAARDQAFWDKLFTCAQMPKALPTGHGYGHGSVRATDIDGFNTIQEDIRARLWDGKQLTADSQGKITLENYMINTPTNPDHPQAFRYKAAVRASIGVEGCTFCKNATDGKESVILDYRIDDTAVQGQYPDYTGDITKLAEGILDPIVHSIRDEIREVQMIDSTGNRVGSGLYVGRANIYKNLPKFFQAQSDFDAFKKTGQLFTRSGYLPSDDEVADGNKYFLGANFSLDFNADAATPSN